jgi:hypothetical protein
MELEKGSETSKNSMSVLSQKLSLENYMEILDAYSLLLFSIIGVEFENYVDIFKRKQRLCSFDRIFSYSDLYSGYFTAFKKLEKVE